MYRDSRTPRSAKIIFTVLAVLYAISPVDIVPGDVMFFPFGLLDDVVLVPLLLWLVTRFTPAWVRQQHRREVGLGDETG